MARFQHLVFVCTNARGEDDPRGCCQSRGGQELLDRLKELTRQHHLAGKVRVTRSGCLDYCAKGCALVIFSAAPAPQETWYTRAGPSDADALFESHILRGEPLERLCQHLPATR